MSTFIMAEMAEKNAELEAALAERDAMLAGLKSQLGETDRQAEKIEAAFARHVDWDGGPPSVETKLRAMLAEAREFASGIASLSHGLVHKRANELVARIATLDVPARQEEPTDD